MADEAPAGTTSDKAEYDSRWRVELVAATFLGLATVITAWALFRAAILGDDVLKNYSESAAAIAQANDTFGKADQVESLEQSIFIEYAVQASAGNEAATAYLVNSIMSDELEAAVVWWAEQPDETGPATPFDESNPNFAALPSQQLLVEGQASLDQAAELRQKAEKSDEKGDVIELATVFLAVTLFLSGIAVVLHSRSIQYALLGLASLVMIVGIVVLIRGESMTV